MGKRVTIPQAVALTGLTEYTLRQGIKQGRYPYIRTSGYKGKILIDIELLEKYLQQEAEDNASNTTTATIPEIINYGQLRAVKA